MKEGDLPLAEWSFKDIPRAEKRACLYYEYARESRKAIEDRLTWRRHFAPGKPWPSFSDTLSAICAAGEDATALQRFAYSPVRIVAACGKFPKVPWLQLPSSTRSRAMRAVRWQDIEDSLVLAKKQKASLPLAKLTTTLFPIFDWSSTNDELVERFRRWLLENRSKMDAPDYRPRGRQGSVDDLLSHLAILRLSRIAKHSRGSARKINHRRMDARNISRAIKKANAFLLSFYP